MSAIPQSNSVTASATQQANRSSSSSDGFNNLDTDQFLKLLINELQNQDPMNPMDNAAMIEQIGQIRQIGASDELSDTLGQLNNNQQLVSASGLIGQQVEGLAVDASEVKGIVDRISVETNEKNGDRSIKVHVGSKTMELKNIREIKPG